MDPGRLIGPARPPAKSRAAVHGLLRVVTSVYVVLTFPPFGVVCRGLIAALLLGPRSASIKTR
jgi:hypothetical protein